jgi:tetratricopeptide (TPR) repeat protein
VPRTGRNDACPCGSGKKYKHCCLDKDRAAQLVPAAAKRAELDVQRATMALQMDEYQTALLQSQALDAASNAVVDLVHAGRLDEAEHAARELLVRYPEVHDGHDRLGMVYEARGRLREAADCYRNVIEIARANPEDYDPEFVDTFIELIDQLEARASKAERAVDDVGRFG